MRLISLDLNRVNTCAPVIIKLSSSNVPVCPVNPLLSSIARLWDVERILKRLPILQENIKDKKKRMDETKQILP